MNRAVALVIGTVLLRPYVFAFLAAFIIAGVRDLGRRRTALFAACVWPLALFAELSSTRTGVPFGLYHYTGDTRHRELFIADVPFMDSLSFVFLAYASFCLARVVLGERVAAPGDGRVRLAAVSGLLMMLLDVVIDPLAVRGDRWFLGRIFYYPEGGLYFGVPLSNFAGWAIVGWLTVGGYLVLTRLGRMRLDGGGSPGRGIALYYGVLLFNLALTFWIREWRLLASGILVHAVGFLLLYAVDTRVGSWRLRMAPATASAVGEADQRLG